MPKHIVILGAGEIGHAVKKLLVEKDLAVSFVDKNPDRMIENGQPQTSPADAIFACIPSRALRGGLESIKQLIGPETLVILLTKGLEPGTKKFNFEVAGEFAKPENVAVLSGPMLAHEIMHDQLCVAALACASQSVFEKIKELFLPKEIACTYEADVKSVALAGVLKNVYALGVGMGDGLGWGMNAKGALISQAIKECREIAETLNSSEQVILGIAGLGDLIATSLSPYSNNRQMGEQIVLGKLFKESEGVVALPSLIELIDGRISELPILLAIKQVIIDGESAEEAFGKLL